MLGAFNVKHRADALGLFTIHGALLKLRHWSSRSSWNLILLGQTLDFPFALGKTLKFTRLGYEQTLIGCSVKYFQGQKKDDRCHADFQHTSYSQECFSQVLWIPILLVNVTLYLYYHVSPVTHVWRIRILAAAIRLAAKRLCHIWISWTIGGSLKFWEH